MVCFSKLLIALLVPADALQQTRRQSRTSAQTSDTAGNPFNWMFGDTIKPAQPVELTALPVHKDPLLNLAATDDAQVTSQHASGRAARKAQVTWRAEFLADAELREEKRSHRTCQVGQRTCKSVCRWLKLTDQDFELGSEGDDEEVLGCPLYDWSMEASGYLERRDAAEAVDCVGELLRAKVLRDDSRVYVQQLEQCMVSVPDDELQKYSAALEVVAGAVLSWKHEQEVRENAAVSEGRLQDAIAQGRRAFQSKAGEAEAVDLLNDALNATKDDEAHYLVDDSKIARQLVEKLAPLITTHAHLREAKARGLDAMQSKEPQKILVAMMWLNATIDEAKTLNIGDEVLEVKYLRDSLLELQSVEQRMDAALFQAKVSERSKLHVREAILELNRSNEAARRLNLTAEISKSAAVRGSLQDIDEARQALQRAVERGSADLKSEQRDADVSAVVSALNSSLRRASDLGLGSNDTADAMYVLTSLQESKDARRSLHNAMAKAHDVIMGSDSLNSTDEDRAIGQLSGAISGAEHVRLKGARLGREMLEMLSLLRDAKVRMVNALTAGDASLQAAFGEQVAISTLAKSIKEEEKLNMTGGLREAKAKLTKLRRMAAARNSLQSAVSDANLTLHTKVIRPELVDELNESIIKAAAAGLDVEANIARLRMDRLSSLQHARQDLDEAMKLNVDAAHLNIAKPNDEHVYNLPMPRVNAQDLIIADLPEVPGGKDDGDMDFQEHIKRLNRSIAVARGYGLVDPEMQEQFARIERLQQAFDAVSLTHTQGIQALETREGVYKASVMVQAALDHAESAGLSVGVYKSKAVLHDLKDLPLAKEELDAAIIQGDFSMHLHTGMHDALVRLNNAMEHAKRFNFHGRMRTAALLRTKLLSINDAWVRLRAASVQGALALRLEHGEVAAADVLEKAVRNAEEAGLQDNVNASRSLIEELKQMDGNEKMETAVMLSADDE